ncbi:hypothetical protein Tco_1538701 [Tanacetum coccineum]
MMPFGLLKCTVTWFSSHISDDEAKSILHSIKQGGLVVIKSLSSLLYEWVRISYSGKTSVEKFRLELHFKWDQLSCAFSSKTGHVDSSFNILYTENNTESRPEDHIIFFHKALKKDMEKVISISANLAISELYYSGSSQVNGGGHEEGYHVVESEKSTISTQSALDTLEIVLKYLPRERSGRENQETSHKMMHYETTNDDEQKRKKSKMTKLIQKGNSEAYIIRVNGDDDLKPQQKSMIIQNLMMSRWINTQKKSDPDVDELGFLEVKESSSLQLVSMLMYIAADVDESCADADVFDDNLQDKIKDLENIVCKMGRSTDTLRLLTNEQKAFQDNLHKSGVGYNGSYVLSQAYAKIPKLYRASELCDKNEQLHVFDSQETLEDAEKSQLKMNEFQKDEKNQELKIQPIDYEKLNKLYKDFVPQKERSAEQTYFSSSCISSVSKTSSEKFASKTKPSMASMPSANPMLVNLIEMDKYYRNLLGLLEKNHKRESIFYTSKEEQRIYFKGI